MYSCTIETETTKSYMSCFVVKSLLGHDSTFESVNEHVRHSIMPLCKRSNQMI